MKSRPLVTALLILPFILPIALSFDLYLPSIPSMPEALSAQPNQIQLTLSIFLSCFGLGQLIIGPTSDRYGRRQTLLASVVVFTLGSILCVLAQNFGTLIVGRILQAFGACGSQVIALALIRDKCEGKEISQTISFLRAGAALSPILSPYLGAYLHVKFGWHANFIVLSFFGLGIFLLALLTIDKNPATKPAGSLIQHYIKSFKAVLSHGPFVYFCLCAMASQAVVFGYFSLSPLYYMHHFGFSENQFATFFSINSCIFLTSALIAGKFIIHRLGCGRTTGLAAAILVVSGIIMFTANQLYDHEYALFFPYLVASIATAMMGAASASGAMLPFKEKAGAASAMFGCSEFMGGCIIGSLAVQGTDLSVFPYAAGIIILGSIVLLTSLVFKRQLATA